MRITKIYWKRFASPVALATGLLIGAFVMLVYRQPVIHQPQLLQSSTPLPPEILGAPEQPQNPFTGLQIYIVGDVAGELLFQVQWPDNSFLTIRQTELEQLGFDVAVITKGIAKVTFESDLIYALPKPSAPVIAQGSKPVHDTENVLVN